MAMVTWKGRTAKVFHGKTWDKRVLLYTVNSMSIDILSGEVYG